MTADEAKQAVATDPAFQGFAQYLREHFGAKLAWFKLGDVEIGKRPEYLVPRGTSCDTPLEACKVTL
jgi:hypothetical protein